MVTTRFRDRCHRSRTLACPFSWQRRDQEPGVNDQNTEGEQKHYICICVYVYKHFTYFQVYLFTLKSLKSLDRWKKPTLISEGSLGGG